jgi:hypothetical protein
MFVLAEQKVSGYDYGVKTSYAPAHLGVDWKAYYVKGFAPKDGEIVKVIPKEQAPAGGNTMWFKPDGENVIIRWLHLSRFIKTSGKVKMGDWIFVTGNTGVSDYPHLHEDIWKNGVVTLKFTDTINPHEYYKQSLSLKKDTMFRTYNGTIYGFLSGYWIAVATSYPEFLADWGNISAPAMTEAQFKAFPVNKRTIK